MCGVLFVKSQRPLGLDLHLQAVDKIKSRGPDFTHYRHHNNVFIAQTVLHITGEDEFYHRPRSDFLAYNGEIYNYRWFGKYSTDTELVYRTVREQNYKKFPYFEGPWAWIYTDFESVRFATDPQGERCLYRYQDDDILIVSSEVSAILCYVQPKIHIDSWTQKHWPVIHRTPYQGIERITPGQLYTETGVAFKIDSIFDWANNHQPMSEAEAQEEFDFVFDKVIADMRPSEPVGVTFSGGVDSGIILAALPSAQGLYTTICEGKDNISSRVNEFLTESQQQRLLTLSMTEQTWAEEYIDIIRRTQMPVQSWSFVGQWHIARHCGQRILFTGVAADELFGGYPVYQTLQFTTVTSASPYSCFDQEDTDSFTLWNQCVVASQGHAGAATLLMDYLVQITAVDARGVDSMTMAHGIEPRSPFMHPKLIKFALNLPWYLRQGKPLLRNQFLKKWSTELLLPKQGFTGHCNDSLPWMGVDVVESSNRSAQWKQIQSATFSKYCGIDSNQ
jgi:asparagine synthetase B (glutamine-hydrolysing)